MQSHEPASDRRGRKFCSSDQSTRLSTSLLRHWDTYRGGDTAGWWGSVGAVSVLALITRLAWATTPSVVVWDEVHFGKMIGHYINGTFFTDVHPPGGKVLTPCSAQLLLTLFAAAGGYNASHPFSGAGLTILGHRGLIFARICCCVLAAALPPLAFTAAWAMTRRLPTALLAGLFVVSETGTLMLTKFILLDSPLLFFMMASFVLLCHSRRASDPDGGRNGPQWGTLAATGLCLGCAVSVKFVGLFTVALVGLHTLAQLWQIFPHCTLMSLTKHVTARIFCLCLLPCVIYGAGFIVHDYLLYKIEDRQEFHLSHFSPGFQMNLEGAVLRNISQAREVTYGAYVTLKNSATGGGYLTTVNSSYPHHVVPLAPKIVFSGRLKLAINYMQVLYVEDDPDGSHNQYSGAPEVVRHGDHIRLVSGPFRLYIGADPALRAAVSPSHNLVYAQVTDNNNSARFIWEVAIDEDDHSAPTQPWNGTQGYAASTGTHESVQAPWLVLDSRVRFINLAAKCFLCFTGRKFPKSWNLDAHELSCSRDLRNCESAWFAEQTTEKRISQKNFRYLKSGLASRFLETHRLMLWMNSQFKPSAPELEASIRPWMWPLCYKSQPWLSNGIRIVLLGNPIVFWLNIVGLCLTVAFISRTAFKMKRNASILDTDDSRVYHWSKWLLLAYLLHYLPFFTMDRVLYYHHYFPALQFSSLLTAVAVGRVVCRLSSIPSLLLMCLVCAALMWSFWAFSFTAYGVYSDQPYDPHNSTTKHLRWLNTWELI